MRRKRHVEPVCLSPKQMHDAADEFVFGADVKAYSAIGVTGLRIRGGEFAAFAYLTYAVQFPRQGPGMVFLTLESLCP